MAFGDGGKASGRTDQFGRLSLPLPPSGTVHVTLTHPQHETHAEEASFTDGKAVIRAEMLRTEVEIPEGRIIVKRRDYKEGTPFEIMEMLEYESPPGSGQKVTTRHGKRETYDRDGNLDEVEHFVMNKLHGENLHYDTTHDGKHYLKARWHWRYGTEHGTFEEYWANGQKRSECEYVRGKIEGVKNEWHSNGKAWRTGRYVGGKEEGVHKRWVQEPRGGRYYFAAETSWRAGKKHGKSAEYMADGEPIFEKQFKDGVEVK